MVTVTLEVELAPCVNADGVEPPDTVDPYVVAAALYELLVYPRGADGTFVRVLSTDREYHVRDARILGAERPTALGARLANVVRSAQAARAARPTTERS